MIGTCDLEEVEGAVEQCYIIGDKYNNLAFYFDGGATKIVSIKPSLDQNNGESNRYDDSFCFVWSEAIFKTILAVYKNKIKIFKKR